MHVAAEALGEGGKLLRWDGAHFRIDVREETTPLKMGAKASKTMLLSDVPARIKLALARFWKRGWLKIYSRRMLRELDRNGILAMLTAAGCPTAARFTTEAGHATLPAASRAVLEQSPEDLLVPDDYDELVEFALAKMNRIDLKIYGDGSPAIKKREMHMINVGIIFHAWQWKDGMSAKDKEELETLLSSNPWADLLAEARATAAHANRLMETVTGQFAALEPTFDLAKCVYGTFGVEDILKKMGGKGAEVLARRKVRRKVKRRRKDTADAADDDAGDGGGDDGGDDGVPWTPTGFIQGADDKYPVSFRFLR